MPLDALLLAEIDWGHMDDDGVIVMMIGMLLFWVLVIVLIVWLIRGGAAQLSSHAREEKRTALEVLDHRYAEGAITTEEYNERREALRSSN